ncbi:TPA: 30S ribosomal protein S8 [Candidatus Woesearchaeota archaeon]|nr:small subunit ribosomal protein S8 [uncultured archaeon]KHO51228.1 MAG: small subunit ribosomal protein S8 [archaeon GW2011_AR11]MBS3110701.1 30S ribosomal protein S8 [Candidatus Woesearchaeota archaeon]HIH04668.1 30S ribosomal protein S8 [Candidatus Woesearchaeota archaeon]HIH91388.1 30S ribosomal protein S8 [Candidatus Woesearchaeota archaeon]
MALNDTLSNALSTILKAEMLGRTTCTVQDSKLIRHVLSLMRDVGYVAGFQEAENQRSRLVVKLSGSINKCGVIKPRYSVQLPEFEKFEKRYLPAKNMGIIVISTPQGITTHRMAKERKSGGRLIAYCY